MHLTDAQLRAGALGVDQVDRLADGWRLSRLPPELLALYAANPGAAVRAHCTSGVRLRFRTDARWVRVALRYGDPARWYFSGAVGVDADRLDAFGPISRQHTWAGTVFTQPDRVPRLLDLWLPHLAVTELLGVEVEAGAALEPAPRPARTWVAYGDSITQGMVATQPVFPWTARLARELDADVVNYGVGGATLHAALADATPTGTPDIVSIAYGANDWNVADPLDAFARNAARLLDALRARLPRAALVVITPIPFFRATQPNARGHTLDDFRAALAAAAAGRPNVHLVRGTDLVPADHSYYHDWSHPNDSGMHEYARNLRAALRVAGVLPAN